MANEKRLKKKSAAFAIISPSKKAIVNQLKQIKSDEKNGQKAD